MEDSNSVPLIDFKAPGAVKQLSTLRIAKSKEVTNLEIKLQLAKEELNIIKNYLARAMRVNCSFKKFKDARIRREVGEAVTIKEISRAYKLWMEEFGSGGGKTLCGSELECRIIDEYGEPTDKKTLLHIRLFYSDEDVEKFDFENRVGE